MLINEKYLTIRRLFGIFSRKTMLTINQNTKIMKLKLQNLIVLAIFMAIGLGLKAQDMATVGAKW